MDTINTMGCIRTRAGVIFLMMLTVPAMTACDKAAADYEKCVKLEAQGDLEGASESCETAVQVDPDSASGTSAAKKLSEIDEVKAERAEEEATAARKTLLSSSKLEDWKQLAEDSPDSPEGKMAAAKIEKQASLCADLDELYQPLRDASSAVSEAKKRFAAMNRVRGGANSHVQSARQLADSARSRIKRLSTGMETLKTHGALPGEEPLRQEIRTDYLLVSNADEQFARAFKGIAQGSVVEHLKMLVVLDKKYAGLLYDIKDSQSKRAQFCTDLAQVQTKAD